jgi:two-component SAPR family response regulator
MDFIIVDDSKLDCFIAEKIIKNTGKCRSVRSFLQAQQALEFIRENIPSENDTTVVLVDIQMPTMSGFEFVAAFEQLPVEIMKHYKVFIISSSINENDINRANSYPSVIQFINKPLTAGNLSSLIKNLGLIDDQG